MTDTALRVLLVEDDPDVPALVEAILERAEDGPYHLSTVPTLSEACDVLEGQRTDVVLVDLGLPDSAGVATVRQLVDQFPTLAIVVLSGAVEESIALESVRAGAQDYIPKQRLDRFLLPRILRHAVERAALQQLLQREAGRLRDANDRLARFAGTVAHDLKGPLTGIYASAETLKLTDRGELNQVQQELIERMSEVALRACSVVDGLLADAQEERTVRRVEVDLNVLAREVLGTVRLDTPAGVATVEVGELPTVWGVEILLRQCLTNLIANAVIHGGRDDRPPRIEVTADVDEEVVVTVADDGPGVPEELRTQIFAEGFTTREATDGHAGLGQGLAITAASVARMGGRIWVDTSELGGAAMRFTLPKRAAEA